MSQRSSYSECVHIKYPDCDQPQNQIYRFLFMLNAESD